jgi:AcrR family transcriptional regulator
MTMDAVAERAGAGKATVYRRWPSKAQLTIDAIVCNRYADLTIDDVPDTGSLRSDLQALQQAKRRIAADTDGVMSGLASVVRDDPEVAAAFHRQFVDARTGVMRDLLERALLRGEIPADRDLDLIAKVVPAMIAYQKMITGKPLEPDFMAQVIERVILPLATGVPAELEGAQSR